MSSMKNILKSPQVRRYGELSLVLLGISLVLNTVEGEIVTALCNITTILGTANLLTFICAATFEWMIQKKEFKKDE